MENVVNEDIQGNVRNVSVNNNRGSCLYKKFLVCNPKEYDGSPVGLTFLLLGSLTLLPSLLTRLPIPHPRDATTGRPALQVITLGGIIYTRENVGNLR
nr:hypothetical protein [Tanacetum cinerariifolium]